MGNPFVNYTGPFERIPEGNISTRKIKSNFKGDSKLVENLEEAIIKSGLKDGDTISFHHHFRQGDYILNQVVKTIAEMGYKDIKLAASSLIDVHDRIIPYIEDGTITHITSSGLRGELGRFVSEGKMNNPVIIRSHGGRARAIEAGDIKIDVAFIGAPSSDDYGNISGKGENTECGSMGYAMVDANYAEKVIVLTDDLVAYPNYPASVDQTLVDLVVKVEEVGDQDGIAKGATRFSKNPKELKIAKLAADFIAESKYFKKGFSFQTGSGGSSLAVTRFLKESMIANEVWASFALGGITKPIVDIYNEGLIKNMFDVQTFDLDSCKSIVENENHFEISASQYANPHSMGAFVNKLDVVILSALEIDKDFNVNVITGSNGILRGASGGHCDTSAGAKLSVIVAPLIRGRIPTVVDNVNTIITPGDTVDVLVTERGIAINPLRKDLIEEFSDTILPIKTIEELLAEAKELVGEGKKIEYEEEVVALIEYRDGTIIDKVHKIKA